MLGLFLTNIKKRKFQHYYWIINKALDMESDALTPNFSLCTLASPTVPVRTRTRLAPPNQTAPAPADLISGVRTAAAAVRTPLIRMHAVDMDHQANYVVDLHQHQQQQSQTNMDNGIELTTNHTKEDDNSTATTTQTANKNGGKSCSTYTKCIVLVDRFPIDSKLIVVQEDEVEELETTPLERCDNGVDSASWLLSSGGSKEDGGPVYTCNKYKNLPMRKQHTAQSPAQ